MKPLPARNITGITRSFCRSYRVRHAIRTGQLRCIIAAVLPLVYLAQAYSCDFSQPCSIVLESSRRGCCDSMSYLCTFHTPSPNVCGGRDSRMFLRNRNLGEWVSGKVPPIGGDLLMVMSGEMVELGAKTPCPCTLAVIAPQEHPPRRRWQIFGAFFTP